MSDQTAHDSPTTDRHARYGIILFIIYVVLYGGFVYLAAFRSDLMAGKPFGGVNLAILYGMGLIVAAFVLALIYMILCRPRPGDFLGGGTGSDGKIGDGKGGAA